MKWFHKKSFFSQLRASLIFSNVSYWQVAVDNTFVHTIEVHLLNGKQTFLQG